MGRRVPGVVSMSRSYWTAAGGGKGAPRAFSLVPMAGLFLVGAAGVASYYFYLTSDEEELRRKQEIAQSKQRAIGRPDIGGPFTMVTDEGRVVTQEDFKGKYAFLYFGFTFCPDICPVELKKMAKVVKEVQEKKLLPPGVELVPIFISVDPWRDSIVQVRTYIKAFHPSFIGMTGTVDQVMRMCKAFRVYTSKPTKADLEEDEYYLVDHSVFMYLMDKDFQFLDYFGQDKTEEEILRRVVDDIKTAER